MLVSAYSQANDSAYKKVRDTVFWLDIYNKDYETLYCGEPRSKWELVTVEHIYPASWIAKAVGCKSRKKCDVEKYLQASSDLHNLFPALKKYKSSRSNLPFGEIDGDTKRFGESSCTFERTTGKDAVVEPRDEVNGVIARSFLYMVHWYDFPSHDLLPLMVKWDKAYPATEKEIKRQKEIEEKQSRKNPFIPLELEKKECKCSKN
jgi:deoxyribonuclease-1